MADGRRLETIRRTKKQEDARVNSDALKARAKQPAKRVLKLIDALPNTIKGRAIGAQLVRSGTSAAANYRAACRARSKAEFVSKMGTVVEEADESALWHELIMEDGILEAQLVQPLLNEANEITAIMVSSKKTTNRSLREREITRSSNHRSSSDRQRSP
jgi:four helix bundle protein